MRTGGAAGVSAAAAAMGAGDSAGTGSMAAGGGVTGGAGDDGGAATTDGLTATTCPTAERGRVSEAGAAVTGGLTTTGPAGGFAAIAGICGTAVATAGRGGPATTADGWRGSGTIFLGAGLAASAGGAGAAATGAAGAGTTGFAGAGDTATAGFATAGRVMRARSSCWRRSSNCRAMSPGLCAWDQSILGFASGSDFGAAPLPPRSRRMCVRTRSASSDSMELECVFFSVTPTAVRASRISLLLTSSSRANSLIRTVLIRPHVDEFDFPPVLRSSYGQLLLWVCYACIIRESAISLIISESAVSLLSLKTPHSGLRAKQTR